jgi:hypothetical protein
VGLVSAVKIAERFTSVRTCIFAYELESEPDWSDKRLRGIRSFLKLAVSKGQVILHDGVICEEFVSLEAPLATPRLHEHCDGAGFFDNFVQLDPSV